LDAVTGKQIWHLEGLHIDATPLFHDGALYVGSYRAEDNQHKDLRLLALKAEDGAVIWSKSIDLSSYSQPVIMDKTVYFTLGTGDIESSGPQPAGAVVAVSAEHGKLEWRTDLPDSVFGSPALFYDIVLVTCRNGTVYALNRTDGLIQWKCEIGAPVIAAPTIADDHGGSFVLAVNRAGGCVKLNVWNGTVLEGIDLVRAAHADSGQFIAAAVSEYHQGVGKRIFIAGSVTRGLRETPILFCIPSND
jgi:outer membrane protein assembly factor BamB